MLCELRGLGLTILAGVVLILVLMEDALRVADTGRYSLSQTVLILVLMEDALRESRLMRYNHMRVSLNPCSNGRCSARPYYDKLRLRQKES